MSDTSTIDAPNLPGTEPAAGTDAPPPEDKPKRPRAPRKDAGPKRRPGRPSKDDKLQEKLTEQISSIALVLAGASAVRNSPALAADSAAVMSHAPDIAAALTKLANENPAVMRALQAGMTGSAWLGLVMAVGALGVELAGNHGLIGDGLTAGGAQPAEPVPASDAFAILSDLVGTDGG